jgi:hypothetical protein
MARSCRGSSHVAKWTPHLFASAFFCTPRQFFELLFCIASWRLTSPQLLNHPSDVTGRRLRALGHDARIRLPRRRGHCRGGSTPPHGYIDARSNSARSTKESAHCHCNVSSASDIFGLVRLSKRDSGRHLPRQRQFSFGPKRTCIPRRSAEPFKQNWKAATHSREALRSNTRQRLVLMAWRLGRSHTPR